MAFQQNAFQQNAFQIGTPGAGVASTTIEWFSPLSEPVRLKRRPAKYQELFFNPIPVVPFGWYQPLREPKSLAKKGLPANLQSSFATDIFTESAAIFAVSAISQGPFFRRTTLYQARSTIPEMQQTVATPDFGWFALPSEPVRTHRLPTSANPFSGMGSFNPIVSFGWFESLTDPVRSKPNPRSAAPFAGMGSFDPIVSFGWNEPFTDPVRKKPELSTSAQLFYTTDPFPIPTPAVVTIYDWFSPLSDPVRKAPALLAANQQPFATDIFTEDSTVFGVSSITSGPFFNRLVMYQAYTNVVSVPPAAPAPDFGWFAALSNPARLAKKGITESLQSFSMQGAVAPIIPSYGWYQALSDPKDLKRQGLRTDLQQSVIQGAVDEIYSFRSTGPLYVNHRSGRPATFWKGRTR